MSLPQQSQDSTRMFSRVIGPFLVIVAAAALMRPSDMDTLMSEFGADTALPFVTGVFTLLLGLIVIALHPYWRGPAAIIVSVLGWWTALEGLMCLTFPRAYISFGESVLDAGVWWQVGVVVIGLVGLYLTYAGWASALRREPAHASS
ncbi:hypothetical protein [Mycobacterium sp. SMC-4]|uniref:hypothetical protein n=1 Tax=Mycobacterium sp. SMC-4 TaxID=2857059 RepID=UPI0021B37F51|nr:hypothetical protein [Mycobacterium sp. SMC-4]UXA19393.1 hypothetical protein KXD98_07240 [Mycobacterium sp. SMC-4]